MHSVRPRNHGYAPELPTSHDKAQYEYSFPFTQSDDGEEFGKLVAQVQTLARLLDRCEGVC
jgi:hypothetical protein